MGNLEILVVTPVAVSREAINVVTGDGLSGVLVSKSAYDIGGDLVLSGFGNLEILAVTPVAESCEAINVVTGDGLSGVWVPKSL